MRTSTTIAFLGLACSAVGCETTSDDPPPGDGRVDPPGTSSMPVPVMSSAFDCETIRTYSACDWLLSTDAVVWGTIRRIEMPHDLLIAPTDALGSWEWTDCSDGLISPGMLIEIEIEQSFHGPLSGVVQVRIGFEQIGRLSPRPSRAADGTIEWTDTHGVGDPLAPGRHIGLALHYVDEHGLGVWSLSGEPMFGLDPDAHIVFGSDGHECSASSVPLGVPGVTLDALAGALASCGTVQNEEAATRERMIALSWGWGTHGSTPAGYAAGYCFLPEEPIEGCAADADCGPRQGCRDGTCVSM